LMSSLFIKKRKNSRKKNYLQLFKKKRIKCCKQNKRALWIF
jgi:hypothetical protein